MPKLDLRNALRIKTSAGEVSRLKWAGGMWPSGSAVLADFYGVGPGLVPIDFRVDDSVLYPATSYIESVRNDGGAGAYFGMTAPLNTRQVIFNASLGVATAAGGTARTATFAPNSPDVAGVHLLTTFKFGNLPGGYEFTNPNYIGVANASSANGVVSGSVSVLGLMFPFEVSDAVLHILEIRSDGTHITAFMDGISLGSQPYALASLPLLSIRIADNWGFGRIISVIVAGAAIEPAVIVARQTLAAQYGIALA
ncbi:hypothetical protein [Pontitalea aquivivens]|uniref:hypothetical protein n=1 Tax=Pontitalea aquivivens TaxID=3388663 RepID=UPI0039707885